MMLSTTKARGRQLLKRTFSIFVFSAILFAGTSVGTSAEAATAVGATGGSSAFLIHNNDGQQSLHGSQWQARKKKRKPKITNPDVLPQPQVQIIPGSTVNLLSRSSKLPIAIKNDYDNEVRVRVRVQASNLKVLFPTLVEVVVPGHTTVTAKVPVTAIADGDVIVHATLETFSGYRLTIPVDIKMNVILGVEDTVLYGFLSFVALLGALGWFRTVRKRRRDRAADTEGSNA